MSASREILDSRKVSSFNLSIATGMALETLFDSQIPAYDPERVVPDRVDIAKYDEFHVNISTLYRNILGSLSTADKERVMPFDLLETLLQEIKLINDLVNHSSNNKTKVVFYHNLYSGLDTMYPNASIRKANTVNQMAYEQQHDRVLTELMSHAKNLQNDQLTLITVKNITSPIKPGGGCLMLTHYAYDLVSDNFSKLHLLESHTGAVKQKAQWYTKFNDGKSLVNIPFNIYTLQIFGDSTTFHPFPLACRKAVIALADKYKWNALTTKDRIKLCFDLEQNPEIRMKLLLVFQ